MLNLEGRQSYWYCNNSCVHTEIDTAKAAAKTKAAKRNEKRKQKKAVAGSDLTTSSRKQEGNLADALENMVYASPPLKNPAHDQMPNRPIWASASRVVASS